MLVILLKLFPKKGFFSGLDFKIPTPQAEDLFVQSIDDTVESYRRLLHDVEKGTLHLSNKDCDTGKETRPGEYALSDKTYAQLLDNLADGDFKQAPPELRENLLAFYANPKAPLATRRKRKAWKKAQDELQQLKETSAAAGASLACDCSVRQVR